MTATLSALILGTYCLLSFLCFSHVRHDGTCGPAKGFLMPLLAGFTLISHFPVTDPLVFVLIGALLLGGLGDVLLEHRKTYVPGGLSFLAGHVLYAALSVTQMKGSGSLPLIPALLGLLVLFPAIFCQRQLLNAVPRKLLPAVICYSCAIACMCLLTFCRFRAVSTASFILCLTGSCLFVLSDSILAHRFFLHGKGIGVMETYTLAQALLAIGYGISL